MAKLINKKTKVIKEIEKEIEISMYLGTNEWEILKEEKKEEFKELKEPFFKEKGKK